MNLNTGRQKCLGIQGAQTFTKHLKLSEKYMMIMRIQKIICFSWLKYAGNRREDHIGHARAVSLQYI